MPIGIEKAPKTLPTDAQKLWVKTFNASLENCNGSETQCDEQAAKFAWGATKRKYRKVNDEWVSRKSEAYHDILLTITKASFQPDGSVRWQAVASDTGKDRVDERTSVDLFQDWIDRVTYKSNIPYLPEPKMPFLGVSHYPALDGYGEAGVTYRMYIDGNTFKADGVFKDDSPIGQKLLDAVRTELAIIKKGDTVEKPIRISAGWWDIQHYHEDSSFLFTRQSLADKCPICARGHTSDKIYKAGQLDHLAATRVPMNTRTSLELEEKSMSKKITRKEDAESIIGPDEAEEMERRARIVGKAETELPEGMVVRANTKIGDFIRRKREDMEMSITELAAKTPVTDGTIGDIESGQIVTPSKPVIAAIAEALKISEKRLSDMLPGDIEPADRVQANKGDMKSGEYMRNMRRKKKLNLSKVAKQLGLEDRELEDLEAGEIEIQRMGEIAVALKMSDEEKKEMLARFGKKRRKTPPMREKAAVKTVDGEKYPAGDFLVVEDPEKPTTWHLQVRRHGEIDRGLMGNAWAALHKGFRGNRYQGPDKEGAIQRLTKMYKDEDAPLPTEKMDYDGYGEGEMAMPMRPLGGAVTIDEAEDFIDTKEKMYKLHSHWDIFQTVVDNIMMADDETVPDKVGAMGQAVADLGGRIDTLKAGLSDAFLIQESTAAYEDSESAEEITQYEEAGIMENYEDYQDHPADQLKAAVDEALTNKALSRPEQEAAVQDAFNEYAQSVQSQIEEANPQPQADQIAGAIKGALAEVLTPLTEQVGLLTAKMSQQEQAPPAGGGLQQVHLPQQKSLSQPTQQPQPVQADGQGHHVSPVLGKPSPLTDIIRKSVGLN